MNKNIGIMTTANVIANHITTLPNSRSLGTRNTDATAPMQSHMISSSRHLPLLVMSTIATQSAVTPSPRCQSWRRSAGVRSRVSLLAACTGRGADCDWSA